MREPGARALHPVLLLTFAILGGLLVGMTAAAFAGLLAVTLIAIARLKGFVEPDREHRAKVSSVPG